MTRKDSARRGEKDEDAPTERSLLARIMEDVIVFAICCFLVKWGVGCILAVRVPLIIMAVCLLVGLICFRVIRWKDQHDDY